VPPRKNVIFCILFYFIFHKPTVDCGELLRYFPQPDTEEGWITYPSHDKSNTVDTASDCC